MGITPDLEEYMASRWIDQFMETVSSCWEWDGLALQIGFQYQEPEDTDDCWEVWVYPALQEIVGGKNDGETGWSGFHFDLSGLLKEVEAEALNVSSAMDDPPELVLEGKFRGKEILLHFCLEPPEDAEATEIIDVTRPEGPCISEKA
jgi:hypothetical protein